MIYYYYGDFMNKKKIIVLSILIICLITLSFSIIKIIEWKKDSNKTKKEIENIEKITEITEVKDNENVEVIKQPEKIDSSNPYWDYIKMNMIDVNISELKKTNSDTKGWIKVEGTNINYPFVQTDNNTFYLKHTFNKKYNTAGWVFMDYRNNSNILDKNTILYAHGRVDNTMFGTLKNILKSDWINNTNNYIIKLSTETENTLWQIFSVYHIKTTSDYLEVNFDSDNEYTNFLNMLINRSQYNFNTTINKDDKILTLSTCYNDSEKMVIHAKLIKRNQK